MLIHNKGEQKYPHKKIITLMYDYYILDKNDSWETNLI